MSEEQGRASRLCRHNHSWINIRNPQFHKCSVQSGQCKGKDVEPQSTAVLGPRPATLVETKEPGHDVKTGEEDSPFASPLGLCDLTGWVYAV